MLASGARQRAEKLLAQAREGSPASGITTRPRASTEEDAGNTKTPQCITESLQEMETQAQCSTSQLATKRVSESARTRPRQQCRARQVRTRDMPAECTCTDAVCGLQTRQRATLLLEAAADQGIANAHQLLADMRERAE
jgi:hypothetical protein